MNSSKWFDCDLCEKISCVDFSNKFWLPCKTGVSQAADKSGWINAGHIVQRKKHPDLLTTPTLNCIVFDTKIPLNLVRQRCFWNFFFFDNTMKEGQGESQEKVLAVTKWVSLQKMHETVCCPAVTQISIFSFLQGMVCWSTGPTSLPCVGVLKMGNIWRRKLCQVLDQQGRLLHFSLAWWRVDKKSLELGMKVEMWSYRQKRPLCLETIIWSASGSGLDLPLRKNWQRLVYLLLLHNLGLTLLLGEGGQIHMLLQTFCRFWMQNDAHGGNIFLI